MEGVQAVRVRREKKEEKLSVKREEKNIEH